MEAGALLAAEPQTAAAEMLSGVDDAAPPALEEGTGLDGDEDGPDVVDACSLRKMRAFGSPAGALGREVGSGTGSPPPAPAQVSVFPPPSGFAAELGAERAANPSWCSRPL